METTTNTAITYDLVGAKIVEPSNATATPTRSEFDSFYDIHDDMLFGKRLESTNFRRMIRYIPWVSGKTYVPYDDQIDTKEEDYYVVADQEDGTYAVFKCLDKKTEVASTVKPLVFQTNAADEVYITGDGYQWKYMGTISNSDYSNFATQNYVPFVENSAVKAAAVDGAIEAMTIENSGVGYNSYTSGNIKESQVGGNSLKYSLDAATTFEIYTFDLIYTTNNATTFDEGQSVDIDIPGANTVTAEVYKTGPGTASFRINANTEAITLTEIQSAIDANTYITLSDANTSAGILDIRTELVPQLSREDDFYKNSVIYLRSGPGVGQIRKIDNYEVNGNERIVTLNTAFSVVPDTTTTFSILPDVKIEGDGTGASAIPVIDSTANSVIDVQIVNRGTGYTYATATIEGNSGILDSNGAAVFSTTAKIRPIISPKGGHGANQYKELHAHNVGIGVSISNTDVKDYFTYSQIAVIKNLLHNDIELTVDAISAGEYSNGEVITQDVTGAYGEVVSIDDANNVITITNVFGEFEISNNQVTGATSNTIVEVTGINRDVSTFDNTIDLTVNLFLGGFEVGETVIQEETLARGYISKDNGTSIELVSVFGEFEVNETEKEIVGQTSGAKAYVTEKTEKKIVDNSGEIFYIENINEVVRSSSSSEKIKLVIKF